MGLESKLDQAKGRAEQAAGDLTNDDELRAQGEQHETEGKLKGVMDKARDKVNEVVDAVSDKVDEKRS